MSSGWTSFLSGPAVSSFEARGMRPYRRHHGDVAVTELSHLEGHGETGARRRRKTDRTAQRELGCGVPTPVWHCGRSPPGGAQPENEAALLSAWADAEVANTTRAYTEGWHRFQRWCDESGYSSLPATARVVAATSTRWPTSSMTTVNTATPQDLGDVGHRDRPPPQDRRTRHTRRDAALIVLGYATALRRENLVRLQFRDFTVINRGTDQERVRIMIRGMKNLQGQIAYVHLRRWDNARYCPWCVLVDDRRRPRPRSAAAGTFSKPGTSPSTSTRSTWISTGTVAISLPGPESPLSSRKFPGHAHPCSGHWCVRASPANGHRSLPAASTASQNNVPATPVPISCRSGGSAPLAARRVHHRRLRRRRAPMRQTHQTLITVPAALDAKSTAATDTSRALLDTALFTDTDP